MFKQSLLATTALVLAASVAVAAHERGTPNFRFGPGHVPVRIGATRMIGKTNDHGVVRNNTPHDASGAIFSNFSKDKNAEFISWYGFTAFYSEYSYYYSQSAYITFTEIGFNAIPITGTGKAPTSMTIPGFSHDPSAYKFEGAILSSVGGLPGSTLATTSATTWSDTSFCCTAAKTVNFTNAPKLKKGQQYFIAVECASNPCYGGWNMEDTDFTGAAVDYWHIKSRETCHPASLCSTSTYSYSSPWHKSTSIPSTGAIIVK